MVRTTVSKAAAFFRRNCLAPVVAAVLAVTLAGAPEAQAATATLTWSAPTTNSDGSSLTDLAGYKVYVGTSSGSYQPGVDVGKVTSYTVSNLTDGGTYYFAITAYNSARVESSRSNEVSKATAVTAYTITASAGTGGSITATGNTNVSSATNGSTTITSVTVASGANQTFSITPASGYSVASLTVDGAAVAAATSYTFATVKANHTIAATFSATSGGTTTGTGTGTGTTTGTAAPIFATNSGGAQYTDASGAIYSADTKYSGGSVASVTSAIRGTADQKLYQSERYGNFTYSVPVANGNYTVTLKLAETYWTAAGKRVFNVAVNGTTAISNLDVFAKVGSNAAYDVTIPVNVSTGTLSLAFTSVVDNAKVCAIVVKPTTAGSPVFAIDAGGTNYLSATGLVYLPDTRFTGGVNSSTTTSAITGTTDGKMYQNNRRGNFSYNIPVANGNYTVRLKFAETYWSAAGSRVFDVAVNGATALSNVDIFSKVGKNAAYDVEIPATVSNGNLSIGFTTKVDNALVSAILVTAR
ncbi:hypothetical protein LPW11_02545 [Geomonas sp. RF6]|uniref:malectin domain-containing carbohydrate-binding protein n=1 Tax=Geomonas sp. RF6 TaxID=2897342 RepID=UPI001E30B212|nr:malectin domain-containing carbohydrate-binding protein [Geomonas sp. RF6]UFS71077.1 hypothetical protein LPW11_02545 [Geomonas sp. RF6]